VINIDGKQSSLSYLNHQLTSITGVQDGVFLCHERMKQLMVRIEKHVLLRLVVAPGTDNAEILRSLRKHIDPVFIPRRLYMVNALQRNSTGKLPYQSLESMVQSLRAAQYKT
jgi:acyl-coenzyme A synthetase/AMP-(fatty) acid ligase